jgi:hypothetical protein
MLKQLNSYQECKIVDEGVIPTGSNAVGGGSKELDHEETIEFLADDKDEDKEVLDIGEKPKSKDKEDKEEPEVDIEEEKPEGDKELEEIEEELKPPTEEQLELVTPVRRREILAKYPQLFKDFPYLEKAYYREQQFTEVFPTIPDAKEALAKSETLDRFEQDLIQGGNTETILKAVKDENPQSFYKIVDNYLPTLAKVDEKAYLHVIGNVTRHTIISMVQEARKSNNEVLQSAAQILNQFVFGTSNFQPPSNLAENKKPEDEGKNTEINQREQAFVKHQFDSTVSDLNTRVNNTLKNTIEANLDPKNSMTDFVRRHASTEALEDLNKLISQDTRFKALADKLWEKCLQENFSRASVDRIKSAYLSKSKTLLPSVIKKARNEPLRGMGKRVSDTDESTSSDKKGPVTPGRPRSPISSGKIKDAKDIPKDMRTIDFLNAD